MIVPIVGFDGYYVSEKGEVFSDRINWYHNPNGELKKRKLKKDNNGYLSVGLHRDGKEIFMLVHRLVASAFIPNDKNKKQVNHKNGIKTDNRVENLEWATRSENMIHAYRVLKIDNPMKGKKWKKRKVYEKKDCEF